MHKLVALLTTVVMAVVMAPAAAQADAELNGPWGATIAYPLYRTSAADMAADALVQLEAPGRAWGLRRSARLIDAAVDGLTIRTTGTCASSPTAVCIRVEIGTYSPEQMLQASGGYPFWQGICQCGDGTRTILLNRADQLELFLRREIAVHEFGHALGLSHHQSAGITSYPRPSYELSTEETSLLNEWFAVPRYRAAS